MFFRGCAVLVSVGLAFVVGIGLYNSGRIEAEERQRRIPVKIATPGSARQLYTGEQSMPQEASRLANMPPRDQPLKDSVNHSDIASASKKALVTPRPGKASRAEKNIFDQLQSTCNYWTGQYNTNRTELSRSHMNVACRDAAEYARRHLNQTIKPNYVAYRPQSRSAGGATLLHSDAGDGASASCRRLKQQRNSINAQLRKGYSVERGNSLRASRRKLENRIHEHC